jgi:phytoene dehydrogenase-like protein
VTHKLDAVVVGSGPNGLAAAITLAREGHSVLVLEAAEAIGGGTRSAELTLPGFVHDVCSAIHPLGVASPFFRSIPLEDLGLEWIHPGAPVAHPMADGSAAVVHRSLTAAAGGFGSDAAAYQRLLRPLVANADNLLQQVLGPPRLPRHPWLMFCFGMRGLHSARALVRRWFREDRVGGMFAGMAAHSILPLDRLLTGAVGLMFCMTAHSQGWPFPRGGSQQLANAMQQYLAALGGRVETGVRVRRLSDVPPARTILFDTSPRQLCEIAKEVLPSAYQRKLLRYRHGPGVFKVDWALDGPIPWRANECRQAGTVHVGGTFEEVAAAEQAAWTTTPAERPFVLVAQQSLFDPSRAPPGKQTGWAYCHVPAGCTFDMTDRIEARIEQFAPGFRDLVLERHVMTPSDFEQYNANYIGGDIAGGVMDWRQVLARPTARLTPYATPARHIFLCSASTPPGAGVHGMCGYYAAQAALRRVLKRTT